MLRKSCSWEQGTALGAIIETDDPQYSIFASSPFSNHGTTPTSSLRLAISAVVRQTSDGRLSQNINDGHDMAALDGKKIRRHTLKIDKYESP